MSFCTQSECQCFKIILDRSSLTVKLNESRRYDWLTVRRVAEIIFKNHSESLLRMKEEFSTAFPGCSFPDENQTNIGVDMFDFRFPTKFKHWEIMLGMQNLYIKTKFDSTHDTPYIQQQLESREKSELLAPELFRLFSSFHIHMQPPRESRLVDTITLED